ncbi:MAG: sulfatase-like hydrolase/transferase [Planctomycetota bacterium]|jgi:arylsulfatase A-like enzyme|nr:sulfatase-like hydrolase/transferase [Planctomycetota bacterium]
MSSRIYWLRRPGARIPQANHPSCSSPRRARALETHQQDRAITPSAIIHAIASAPVCCPVRACLLSGLYPDRHGVVLNDTPLDPELPTLGKAFAAAGYATAWVGKWHVDGNGRTSYIPRERRQGFRHFAALECSNDYNNSRYYLNDDPTPRTWDGYDAQAQTDHLCAWLDQRDATQPFCAFLSWGPPHSPYHTAPEADRARYVAEYLALHPNVPTANADQARSSLAGYYAHCTALDRCFGQLLDHLDTLGLSDTTIVVFTSDHGDFLGSHGMWDKQGPWEESLRVPFLIRGPMLPAGRNASLLSTVDHFQTLAALCGVEAPPEAATSAPSFAPAPPLQTTPLCAPPTTPSATGPFRPRAMA